MFTCSVQPPPSGVIKSLASAFIREIFCETSFHLTSRDISTYETSLLARTQTNVWRFEHMLLCFHKFFRKRFGGIKSHNRAGFAHWQEHMPGWQCYKGLGTCIVDIQNHTVATYIPYPSSWLPTYLSTYLSSLTLEKGNGFGEVKWRGVQVGLYRGTEENPGQERDREWESL